MNVVKRLYQKKDSKQLLKYGLIAYGTYFTTSIIFAILNEKLRKYNSFTTGEQVLKGIDLTNKYIIVTGASAGLGKETTKLLIKKGCIVYMAVRNIKKAEKVKKEIIQNLKEFNIKNIENKIIIKQIDLSSLESVYNFAKQCLKEDIKIDFLINNAGVMAQPNYQTTKDGIEYQFGINHLGHYYMTTLLLPILKKNKTRIINLSSTAHMFGFYKKTKFLFDYAYQSKEFMGKYSDQYSPVINYGISKVSNILFTRQFNNLYKKYGILSCALHPGVILSTELTRDIKFDITSIITFITTFCGFLISPSVPTIEAKSVSRGVATTLRCVGMTTNEILNNKYCYYSDCRCMKPSYFSAARYVENADKDFMAKKLFDVSDALIISKGFKLEVDVNDC